MLVIRQSRTAVLSVVLTGLLTASLAPSVNAGDTDTYWGWVVARRATKSAYDPSAENHGSATGAGVHVFHGPTGHYSVTFDGMTASSKPQGGIAHVSPIGTAARHCSVTDTHAIGSIDLQVELVCYKANGDPVDTQFALQYLASRNAGGTLGYMTNYDDTSASTFPDEFSSFNSAAGDMTVTRLAQGSYVALFKDLHAAGGSVQATSFTSDGCRAGSWTDVAAGLQVGIRCYDAAGALTDAEFRMTYMNGLGMKGFGGTSVAYLLADKPKLASYTPSATYRFSTEGGTPNVKHIGKGYYRVTLPNFEVGGAAVVTATGDGKQLCQLGALPTTGSPKKVDVRCFTPAGAAANSPFALSFVQ